MNKSLDNLKEWYDVAEWSIFHGYREISTSPLSFFLSFSFSPSFSLLSPSRLLSIITIPTHQLLFDFIEALTEIMARGGTIGKDTLLEKRLSFDGYLYSVIYFSLSAISSNLSSSSSSSFFSFSSHLIIDILNRLMPLKMIFFQNLMTLLNIWMNW